MQTKGPTDFQVIDARTDSFMVQHSKYKCTCSELQTWKTINVREKGKKSKKLEEFSKTFHRTLAIRIRRLCTTTTMKNIRHLKFSNIFPSD